MELVGWVKKRNPTLSFEVGAELYHLPKYLRVNFTPRPSLNL